MATPSELREAQRLLTALTSKVQLCESLAQALIDTNQSWTNDGGLLSMLFPTDYEQGRRQVISACHRANIKIRKLRRNTLSPHLIHSQHQLGQVRRRCERCAAKNKQRQIRNDLFVCLVREDPDESRGPFRFQLDEKGQIVELG